MNVSYRWLQRLAPTISESAQAVAERLTDTAVPVDEVVWLGEGLDDIVIGRVAQVSKHPNADRLVVCKVDIGSDESVQVVTGAPNVFENAFYPFVGVGSTLPGGLTIKRTKLRGEYSEGMLCSERELNLGRDHEGIMQLNGDYVPGTPLIEALDLDDYRLILDITANRPDLLGHIGVAREAAPGGHADLTRPAFTGQVKTKLSLKREAEAGETAGVRVSIEDVEGCPRYTGVVIRGVTLGPSPEWLARDLRAVGLHPINSVVDATNYVLYEFNQPIHAFDLAKLRGPEIIVRRARKGEKLRTLDGKDRELDSDVLVIADAEGPCALAGIMGGGASEVTGETRDLFIEVAYFDPQTVRRGARKLEMETDASYRFQRGIDPAATPEAVARVVDLVLAVAGGSVDGEGVDVNPRPAENAAVELRTARVKHVLGVELKEDVISQYLVEIGFDVKAGSKKGSLSVDVPAWRPDVEREVDLIEEVARRYGYDKFPDELGVFRPTAIPEDEFVQSFDRLRDFFVGLGFLESRGSPFAPPEEGEISILNPLSELESHLRVSLLHGLIHYVEHNFAQGRRDVQLFELGTVFKAPADGAVPDERLRVGAVWTGARRLLHWADKAPDFDIWDLKWFLESVVGLAARGAAVRPLDIEASQLDVSLEDAFAVMTPDGQAIGWGGRIVEGALEAPRWAASVWCLELEISTPASERIRYRPLPIYPAIERDLAVLVPKNLMAAEVGSVIRDNASELLEQLSIFDVYEGEGTPAGTRSIAWRLRFRSPSRTLTDEEIDSAVGRIVAALEEGLNVGIRGA